MSFTFREADSSDAPSCVEILENYIDQTPWINITLDETQELVSSWGNLFESEEAWVALDNDRIVGFCERTASSGNNIGALYVVPELRSVGIGKRLLDMAKADCDQIIVWAYEKNVQGRRFYRREGLVENYREFDEDCNLMDIMHIWKNPYS